MKIFMKFIVPVIILSICNISMAIAETPEEKGLRLACLLYTSPSPRDVEESRMPSSA